ncbi:hypothetical protein GCM10011579_061010 [Streptomyces albiflavescens]|uniref:Uncharacterized protein n=1 Tax=Streptomyces albiflavescens TaxID=1623582 RepID=A0A918D768_9ACTN|nr:hypothetical protein [Streptomyces albiflavescens]GGN78126.1 hypothetical protein GCM10011579_061010 [Streptomyces albiflavescens]
MNQKEVESEHVRELLGRAVHDVRAPGSRGSEAVFAQASRVRWRRRAAATGAVAAAVAAGLVAVGPGLLNSGGGGSSVASEPTAGEFTTQAAKFAKLLPAGTGKISEVSLLRLVKQVPKAPLPKRVGPYDGDYAVSRDGGTGYLSVRVLTSQQVAVKTGRKGIEDPCKDAPKDGRVNCTTEKLPNGSLLGIWQEGVPEPGSYSYPKWGKTYVASLKLTDGGILQVRDTTGFQGKGQLGPLLKTPPLTRAQLHKLILNPVLLP